MQSPLPLLIVTNAELNPDRDHFAIALAAMAGGASAIQIRAKDLVEAELRPLVRRLAPICARRGKPLLVTGRPDIAAEVGADGAHLEPGDPMQQARDVLGADRLLGITVETPAQSEQAAELGANYLTATVWQSATRPEAMPVGLEGLQAIVAATGLPVVATGGVHAGNLSEAIAAGASGVAVTSAVVAARDAVTATRDLLATVEAALAARGRPAGE